MIVVGYSRAPYADHFYMLTTLIMLISLSGLSYSLLINATVSKLTT